MAYRVVKIGGKVIDQAAHFAPFLSAFSAMPGQKVLVHGGGKLATDLAERMGLQVQMVQGRRITDEAMLEVAVMVYGGKVNKRIVAGLKARGTPAMGLAGADGSVVEAHRRPVHEGLDYGFVGDVERVNGALLQQLLQGGLTPVLAPLSCDAEGQLLNTNADTIASETAVALAHAGQEPVELFYCFELPGVLKDRHDPASLIPHLTPAYFQELREQGIIAEGMIPKLDNAFRAIERGVAKVYILSANQVGQAGSPDLVGTLLTAE